ncbi:MAG: DUF393 domain-containing protein [Planctomycetota bacterium]
MNPTTFANLPNPIQFPDSDVVIYDGDCKFCQAQVKRLYWFDQKNRLSFVSLHSDFVREQFPDLTYEQLMSQMYIIPASDSGYSDKRYGGAAAIRYLSRRLPKLWLAFIPMHIPFSLPIWQWMYNRIAERRYRIAGKSESCDPDGSCDLHFSKLKPNSSGSDGSKRLEKQL